MLAKTINRTIEFKLYLNQSQESILDRWLDSCRWLYNLALRYRTKAYKRRKECINYFKQQKWLTNLRSKIPFLQEVPAAFQQSALRKLQKSFDNFFRRIKLGVKPGFPRFKKYHRYNSLECPIVYSPIRGNKLLIPKLGLVSIRGLNQDLSGKQKILRIIRRPSGWYAQIVVEREIIVPFSNLKPIKVGIDVGLESFATFSNGTKIKNPRFYRKSEKKLKRTHKNVSRKKKGSKNRKKAIKKLARQYEKITRQRRSFAHEESRKIVNKYDFISYEKLNINNMIKNHKLSKSIMDAAWSQFLSFVSYKAESAGKIVVGIDSSYTSQTCPDCGHVKKKSLKERTHSCKTCGLVIDRDEAAARVILSRAITVVVANTLVENETSDIKLSFNSKSRRRSKQSCVAT